MRKVKRRRSQSFTDALVGIYLSIYVGSAKKDFGNHTIIYLGTTNIMIEGHKSYQISVVLLYPMLGDTRVYPILLDTHLRYFHVLRAPGWSLQHPKRPALQSPLRLDQWSRRGSLAPATEPGLLHVVVHSKCNHTSPSSSTMQSCSCLLKRSWPWKGAKGI